MMGHMTGNAPPLGAKIRRARERAQLSQEQLAKAVGASVRAVGDWENNRRRPRNRTGALESILGIDLTGDQSDPGPDPAAAALAAELRDRLAALPADRRAMVVASLISELPAGAAPRRAG